MGPPARGAVADRDAAAGEVVEQAVEPLDLERDVVHAPFAACQRRGGAAVLPGRRDELEASSSRR